MTCTYCDKPIKSRGMCSRHYERYRNGATESELEAVGNRTRGTGSITSQGYMQIGRELEHRILAEKALGRPLKPEERVHHFDENRANNSPSNLVVCPNQAYHQLLHKRMKALDACGHADWLFCNYCAGWSAPNDTDMYNSPTRSQSFHRSCQAEYKRDRRAGL